MNCPKCGAPLPEGAKFCGSCGARLTPPAEPTQQVTVKKPTVPVAPVPEEVTVVQPDMGAAAKKGPRGKLVLIAVVLLIAILAGVFFVLGRGGSSKNAYILLQDGTYGLLTDLSKEKVTEIASARSAVKRGPLVYFSEDEKYVYYFTKYNSDSSTVTICRAEYAKLKDGSSKNDDYITTVANNAKMNLWVTKNGILYRNDESTLYYFDGTESIQLAKNAVTVFVNEENTDEVLFTKDNGEGTVDLYYGVLENADDLQKLSSRVNSVYLYNGFSDIAYTKSNDGEDESLYHVSPGGEPEKISSHFVYCYEDDTNHKLFYYKDTGKTISTYDFVNDPYQVTEAPDWDDYRTLGSDGWYVYDNDGYYAAYDHYRMRESLMNSGVQPIQDLYCYENGEETLIEEDVLSIGTETNCFLYGGKDVIQKNIDMDVMENSGLYSSSEIGAMILESMDLSQVKLYDEPLNSIIQLSENLYDWVDDLSVSTDTYAVGNQIIMIETGGNKTLVAAEVKDGVLGEFEQIADDAEIRGENAGVLYYTTGSYTQGTYDYADFYRYADGKVTCLVKDALLLNYARVYEDGQVCVYTGNRSGGLSFELTLANKDGSQTVIADDVSYYLRVDKNNLLYISDGDLYWYNGKDKKRVVTDVDYFWVRDTMEDGQSIDMNV